MTAEREVAMPAVLADEVRERFGVLPNLFTPPPGSGGADGDGARTVQAPAVGVPKSCYLDNPLPSLFKERLFVHLSRFCEVRHCIIRHVCFLFGEGRPATG